MFDKLIEKIQPEDMGPILGFAMAFSSFCFLIFCITFYNSLPVSEIQLENDYRERTRTAIFNQCNGKVNSSLEEIQNCIIKLNQEFKLEVKNEQYQ
jgi:hypothetical protein